MDIDLLAEFAGGGGHGLACSTEGSGQIDSFLFTFCLLLKEAKAV
jgi:hypothetical protein